MSVRARPVHLSMIRGFQLADFLTLANAACGVLAVFAVMGYVEARAPRRLLAATATTATSTRLEGIGVPSK